MGNSRSVFLAILILFNSSLASAAKISPDVTFMAQGGVEDTFNIISLEGIAKAHEEFDFTSQVVEYPFRAGRSQPGRITAEILSTGSGLFIGAGFTFTNSAIESALRYPKTKFAILDDPANAFLDPPLPNLWSSDFTTEEPSFLAGYLAAATSTTKIIATFGGLPIPPVLRFMEGFKQGAAYYNVQNQDSVAVLETFEFDEPFSFESGALHAREFIAQGADRIFPVAGAGLFGALQVVADEAADDVRVVGVDVNVAKHAPEFAAIVLTSVVKRLDVAVVDAIEWFLESGEPGRIYIGTLENGGTDLAPLNPEVSAYQTTIDALAQQIIDGQIVIPLPF